MSEPCKIKIGSLECEECDDWVIITEAIRDPVTKTVKVKQREVCKRALASVVGAKGEAK